MQWADRSQRYREVPRKIGPVVKQVHLLDDLTPQGLHRIRDFNTSISSLLKLMTIVLGCAGFQARGY